MVSKCDLCGSDDLKVIRCEKCDGERFIMQKMGWADHRTGKGTTIYDNESPLLERSYEYICYDCGNKLTLPRLINSKGTKNNRQVCQILQEPKIGSPND